MEFNKYQTPIEELTYDKVENKTGILKTYHFNDSPEEVREEFYDYLNNVPYIQWLVSKDRPTFAQCPKDKEGKAIWKIEYPPILEDVDYFRKTAIHFQLTGKFTDLRPNPNPNSPYAKWLKEEVRRIRHGYLRPSDGAYITGNMYWYLNYSPITLTRQSANGKKGYRTIDFPDFWEGIMWRYEGWERARNVGQHFAEISSRGKSKSFSSAAALSKIFIIGNEQDSSLSKTEKQGARGVVMAYQKEFLNKDGTLNKFEDMKDFLALNTEFPRKTLKNSINDMDWIAGYIDLNTGAKRGSGNEIMGIAVKDDPDKGRGKRADLVVFEEFGKFPNVASVLDITLPSVTDGEITFGQIVAIGTGGEEGNDFAGAMDMIYHPAGSHMYSFENVWDKQTQTKGNSIFCFPSIINRKGCYNSDGISDVTKALFAVCWMRYIARHENPNPMAITRVKAENPITLQDAIMRRDGTKFPVSQIVERLQEIDTDPNFYNNIYVGKLVQQSNGQVVFSPTADTPIRSFPHKTNQIVGAVEISKMPEKGSDGKVFSNRYYLGNDPVDDDVSTTTSLFSVFVWDSWTDNIVAEWTGRFNDADSNYEVMRLLAIFYNGLILCESNKKGWYSYFKMRNCLYLIAETPEILKEKDYVKGQLIGNKAFGVNANNVINNWARTMLVDWLLKPVELSYVDSSGVEHNNTIPKVMTMWNRAALQEMQMWNIDGNFDRVSALGILMIMREEVLSKTGGHPESYHSNSEPDLSDDDFFSRNYYK